VLILSYLTAFGPASVKDMQCWSGLTRLQPVVDALRAELMVFRDELGRELFDVPDAPLPSVETPVPVRFMPDFDSLLLAHYDRQRIIADKYRSFVFPGNSMVLPTFLVDGFVRGVWKIERTSTGAKLLIQPFEPLANSTCEALQTEGECLLHWVAEKTTNLEVVLQPYDGTLRGQNMWGRI
jgi:hypothetical protein